MTMTPPTVYPQSPRLVYRDPSTQKCWFYGEGGVAHWVTVPDPADAPTTVLAALTEADRDWPLRPLPIIVRIPGPHPRGRHRMDDGQPPPGVFWYLVAAVAALMLTAAVMVAVAVTGGM